MAHVTRPVFMHAAPVRGQSPEEATLRAAFGEGSAARHVLLDFLSLRSGLLPLRCASHGCKTLVGECALTTQYAAPEVPVFTTSKPAATFVDAFPRARLSIEYDDNWTLADFSAIAHCSTLQAKAFLFVINNMDCCSDQILRRIGCKLETSLCISTNNLTAEGFKYLKSSSIQHISLARHFEIPLRLSYASIGLLQKLESLALYAFSSALCCNRLNRS